MCSLNLQRPKSSTVSITPRRLRAINIDAFQADLRSSIAGIDFVTMDVESCVEKYNLTLSSLLDKHAPSRTRTVRLRPNSPWFYEGIRVAKQKRRRLERKWRRSKLEIDLQLYCEQKNTVNKLIEQAKIDYYSSKINEKVGDQKQLFNIVNDLLQKAKNLYSLFLSLMKLLLSNSLSFLVRRLLTFVGASLRNVLKLFHVTMSQTPLFFLKVLNLLVN